MDHLSLNENYILAHAIKLSRIEAASQEVLLDLTYQTFEYLPRALCAQLLTDHNFLRQAC